MNNVNDESLKTLATIFRWALTNQIDVALYYDYSHADGEWVPVLEFKKGKKKHCINLGMPHHFEENLHKIMEREWKEIATDLCIKPPR